MDKQWGWGKRGGGGEGRGQTETTGTEAVSTQGEVGRDWARSASLSRGPETQTVQGKDSGLGGQSQG